MDKVTLDIPIVKGGKGAIKSGIDAFGSRLEIGDSIIYSAYGGQALCKGVVEKFTRTRIVINIGNYSISRSKEYVCKYDQNDKQSTNSTQQN